MRVLLFAVLLPFNCWAQLSSGGPIPANTAPSPRVEEPRGLDFNIYIRLQTGMTEGELLSRAGKPDSESVENFRHDVVKTYYYLPTRGNPGITAITLRGGRISHIERTKKFF